MRRFFVDRDIDDSLFLDGEEHTHLATVLRLTANQEIVVYNGNGIDYHCVITSISKQQTQLSVINKTVNTAEPNIDVHLFFGNLKSNDKVEFIVQKSVELGVNRITPFVSTNTVAKNINYIRLNKIAIEAVKQCGRCTQISISDLLTFDAMCQDLASYDMVIFAYEKASGSLIDVLGECHKANKIAIVVGSEGGFTESEVGRLANNNTRAITLGRRILRAETANIALVSIVMYSLGQMNL